LLTTGMVFLSLLLANTAVDVRKQKETNGYSARNCSSSQTSIPQFPGS
jgi:hypothetical protein